MSTYTTLQGDVADQIAHHQLGDAAHVTDLMTANPGLAGRGPVLPQGVVLVLPEITPVVTPRLRLWGAV